MNKNELLEEMLDPANPRGIFSVLDPLENDDGITYHFLRTFKEDCLVSGNYLNDRRIYQVMSKELSLMGSEVTRKILAICPAYAEYGYREGEKGLWMAAAQANNPDGLRVLAEAQVRPDWTYDHSPLSCAAIQGAAGAVAYLLTRENLCFTAAEIEAALGDAVWFCPLTDNGMNMEKTALTLYFYALLVYPHEICRMRDAMDGCQTTENIEALLAYNTPANVIARKTRCIPDLFANLLEHVTVHNAEVVPALLRQLWPEALRRIDERDPRKLLTLDDLWRLEEERAAQWRVLERHSFRPADRTPLARAAAYVSAVANLPISCPRFVYLDIVNNAF